MKKKLTKKETDEIINKIIKILFGDPPKYTQEFTLSDGTIVKALVMCVYCTSYISQNWNFCPTCGKKSEKLSDSKRKEIIIKRFKKLLNP